MTSVRAGAETTDLPIPSMETTGPQRMSADHVNRAAMAAKTTCHHHHHHHPPEHRRVRSLHHRLAVP